MESLWDSFWFSRHCTICFSCVWCVSWLIVFRHSIDVIQPTSSHRIATPATDAAEELGIKRPQPVGLSALGLILAPGALFLIPRGIVPETDDGFDPSFHFLGRGQDLALRREPPGEVQQDARLPQGLGYAGAVRADDRDAVDRGSRSATRTRSQSTGLGSTRQSRSSLSL